MRPRPEPWFRTQRITHHGGIPMFGRLGTMEILLIVLVILLLFGGAKLPQLARGLGDSIKEFRKAVKQDDEKKETENKEE